MIDYEKVTKNIRTNLIEYLTKYDSVESLVIGVSGGIDSALCIALAEPVCKRAGVRLIGRSLPILTNKKDECDRADAMGKAFDMDYKTRWYWEVDLAKPFSAMHDFILTNETPCEEDSKEEKIRIGNIKARCRMIYLYNLAYATKGMVLSTDNLTEYNLGFWSLHADCGDYGMIQNLWKTEVYELASYLVAQFKADNEIDKAEALQRCIDATPTDGLGITSSDIEQLGVKNYAEADAILRKWCERYECDDPNHPVILRHLRTEFKRNNPYNIPRETLLTI